MAAVAEIVGSSTPHLSVILNLNYFYFDFTYTALYCISWKTVINIPAVIPPTPFQLNKLLCQLSVI